MAKKSANEFDFEDMDIGQALRSALGDPPAELGMIKDVQVLQRALLQREARRLEGKLGEDHPRVKRLHARLEANLGLVREMEVELEKARIRVPEVEEEGALIHGRVVDRRGRGNRGLMVTLVDEGDKPIKKVPADETDASGYFAFPVGKESLTALTKLEGKGPFIVVHDSKGKKLYRDDRPLPVAETERTYREVPLGKDRPPTGKGKRKRKPKREEPKDEPWVVKGVVMDEQGEAQPGLLVRVVDKDRQYDDLLGAAQTDKEGRFEISYRLQDFKEGPEPGADLYLLVTDEEGEVLYSSEEAVRYDAGRVEEYEITIEGDSDEDKEENEG